MTTPREQIEAALAAGFLAENHRFKLNFGKTGYTNTLGAFRKVLDGEWVALLPASNDAHMPLFANIRALLAQHDAEIAALRAELAAERAKCELLRQALTMAKEDLVVRGAYAAAQLCGIALKGTTA